MTVFVDTSALFALLDGDQTRHREAAGSWAELLEEDAHLLTTNYVLLEATALSQRRLGLEALRELHYTLVPLLEVAWIEAEVHRAALTALLASGRRAPSLVDWSSFETMNRRGIRRAFALNADFADQGFEVLPA